MDSDTIKKGENALTKDDRDEFDFEDYSAPLARRLLAADPPFTLGIFGRWGSGKTTLMDRIDDQLRKQLSLNTKSKKSILTIKFNAWQYDREDAIWRALLVHTLEALERYLVKTEKDINGNDYYEFPDYQNNESIVKELRNIKSSLYRTVEQRQKGQAGDALGLLGAPRFDKSCWENPDYWVSIEEGEFYRGSVQGAEGAKDNEIDGSPHKLAPFEITRYPTTNADYQRFAQATGQSIPNHWSGGEFPHGLANHPVVNVNWNDAHAYIHWLNSRQDGYRYKLPSEAQWERAARGKALIGGKDNRRRYPWGDVFDAHKCNVQETGLGRTCAVGCFPHGASPDGVLDMAGNVWEWCADWFDENYYQLGSVEENKTKGKYRVLRGGSFRFNARNVRCASRDDCLPNDLNDNIGFRVARMHSP